MTFSVGEDKYQLVRTVAPNRMMSSAPRRPGCARWMMLAVPSCNSTRCARSTLLCGTSSAGWIGSSSARRCSSTRTVMPSCSRLTNASAWSSSTFSLGLTALADARKALHTTDKAVQRNMERLSDRRADLPVDPAATAKEAADRSTAMTQLAERARAGADTLKALVEKAADLTGQVRALEEAAALRVAGADGYERLVALGVTLEGLVTAEKRISGEISTAKKAKADAASALDGAQKALEAVEKEHGKAGSHDVVTQQLGELGRLLHDQLERERLRAQADEALEGSERRAGSRPRRVSGCHRWPRRGTGGGTPGQGLSSAGSGRPVGT